MGICYQVRYSSKDCDGVLKYDYVNIDLTMLKIGDGAYGMFLGTNVAGAVVSLAAFLLFACNDFCIFNEVPTMAELAAAATAPVVVYAQDAQRLISLTDAPFAGDGSEQCFIPDKEIGIELAEKGQAIPQEPEESGSRIPEEPESDICIPARKDTGQTFGGVSFGL